MKRYGWLALLFFLIIEVSGQVTVSGTVYEKGTTETIPFVRVSSPKYGKSVETDLEGKYTLTLPNGDDSLTAMTYGFPMTKAYVSNESNQTIDFFMGSDIVELTEVVLLAPENPMIAIMKGINSHKKENDYNNAPGYHYKCYSRVEIDADNITESFKQKKIFRKVGEAIQELELIKDEDGNELLPVGIFETISEFSVLNSPYTKKESVIGTKAYGIGIEDGSVMSQFVGASYQQFNIYDNTITVFEKEFLSPVSAFGHANYKYELVDTSIFIGGDSVLYIKFKPKRPQDLAFIGVMEIGAKDYALRTIDMRLQDGANLNFMDKLSISREWKQSDSTYWLPKETYIEVGISELSKNLTGLLVRSRTAFSDVEIKESFANNHFDYGIEVAEDRSDKDEAFWQKHRVDSLSADEKRAEELVKEVSDLPIVKSYLDLIDNIVSGYYLILGDKIGLGPYSTVYANNEIEGHRFRIGFRTTNKFSTKVEIKSYVAYGTRDEAWKYEAKIRYVLTKKPWSEVGVSSKKEIDLFGITGAINSPLFRTVTKWGEQNGAGWNDEQSIYYYKQLNRHFSGKVMVKRNELNPLFNYLYFNPNNLSEVKKRLTTSEVVTSLRFAKNEVFTIDGMKRTRLGGSNWPTVDLDYTYGLKGVLGSDLEYHKLNVTVFKKIGLGGFGRTKFWLKGGKIFNDVPLHVLKIHLGNPTPFYSVYSNNTMNFFEFASDEYLQFTHVHRFDGFFMNRIPLIRKLKWRSVVTSNAVWGRLSKSNRQLIASGDLPLNTLEKKPFVEVGYGLENIFKVLRVQAFHRLTYRDVSKAQNFGIKVALLISL